MGLVRLSSEIHIGRFFSIVYLPIQFSDLYVEHIEWKSRLISKSFDQLSEKEENMELKFIQI